MKILLIGASGVLGRRLYNDAIKKKWQMLGTYCSHECKGLSHLDLKDRKSVEKIFNSFKPEVVLLAGGITDVDLCESRPGFAEEVNIKGTLNLAKRMKERNAKMVFVSTDYIFDGKKGPYKEDDKPRPVNVYGRTKLEAENIIKSILDDYLIVRTAQLYGIDYKGRNFAVKIIHNMKNNKKVYAADDFYCTPTYAGSLSEAIIELIKKGKTGVYHAAGPDFINRYDYVNKIADIFTLDKSFIIRVKLKDLHLKAKRPEKAGLNADKLRKEIGSPLYGCDKGLKSLKREIESFGHA